MSGDRWARIQSQTVPYIQLKPKLEDLLQRPSDAVASAA
jgi:hypothetical protein